MDDRQQVIESVDKAWTKDLIIRYLYVKFANFFERDLEFFFADIESQVKYVNNLPSHIGRKVICLSLCQYFQEVFEIFNINSKIVPTNDKIIPHYALIVEGSYGWYYIDPLKDLMNNQAGFRTAYYGIIPNSKSMIKLRDYSFLITLSLDYVKEMDDFLELYPDGVLNDYLEKIHLELTTNKAYIFLGSYLNRDLSNFDRRMLYKMKMIFLNQMLINKASIPGKIERAQFYNFLLCSILNHSERARTITRLGKEVPIVVKFDDTIYVDKETNKGRVLSLEANPSQEISDLLRNNPRFRL